MIGETHIKKSSQTVVYLKCIQLVNKIRKEALRPPCLVMYLD